MNDRDEARDVVRQRLRLHRLAFEGMFSEASRLADRLLADSPADTDLLYLKGANYFQAKRYDDAVEVFDAILELDEGNPDAWRAKGICFAEQGLYARALPAYRAALGCAPDDPLTLNEMGKSLAHLDKHTEAVEAFGLAAKLQPRFAEAWHYLARSLDHIEKTDEARMCFDQAVRIDPDRADAWVDRGVHFVAGSEACKSQDEIKLRLGLLYEALRSFECALGVDPHHHPASVNRTSILRLLGPKLASYRPAPPAGAPPCSAREESR